MSDEALAMQMLSLEGRSWQSKLRSKDVAGSWWEWMQLWKWTAGGEREDDEWCSGAQASDRLAGLP